MVTLGWTVGRWLACQWKLGGPDELVLGLAELLRWEARWLLSGGATKLYNGQSHRDLYGYDKALTVSCSSRCSCPPNLVAWLGGFDPLTITGPSSDDIFSRGKLYSSVCPEKSDTARDLPLLPRNWAPLLPP